MSDTTLINDPLFAAACAVRENAHAPYSRFAVGAVITTRTGAVFAGCNVENAAYPEGTCAETGAIAAMVAAGENQIERIVVVSNGPVPVMPCGGCRQRLAEFARGDIDVVCALVSGSHQTRKLAELLPGAFAAAHMGKAE